VLTVSEYYHLTEHPLLVAYNFVCLQASGKMSEKEMMQELLTIRKMLSDIQIQLCPKCQMPIVKSEGCNKMSCGNCGQLLCFRCGRAISGYDHFW
jgi:E3 ubiquitin-protein ligase RNF14